MNQMLTAAAAKGAEETGKSFFQDSYEAIKKAIHMKIEKMNIDSGERFEMYLCHAYQRWNRVKTLATGNESLPIIGEGSIYVQINVSPTDETKQASVKRGSDVDTSCAENLLKHSNHVLVVGTVGAGKTMLMRYLFLKMCEDLEYIPLYIELRKISKQKKGSLSIESLINSCMNTFANVNMTEPELVYALDQGKFLFLFDGFDEIQYELCLEAAERIQEFSAKYPENGYIITSREQREYEFSVLQTFDVLYSKPMNLEQAKELARKLRGEPEQVEAFCEQLEKELYRKHKQFVENPLLLTMMYQTFMWNGSIPEHLADFYSKCFDALYSTHDGTHNGGFKRPFQSELSESDFKMVFAHFCFQTYFKEKYEFTKKEILQFLENSLAKCGVRDANAENLLRDLRTVVCLIVREGDTYRFAHRSFQTYFAAVYSEKNLKTEKQWNIIREKIFRNLTFGLNYQEIIIQINPEIASRYLIEPEILETGIEEFDSMDLVADDDGNSAVHWTGNEFIWWHMRASRMITAYLFYSIAGKTLYSGQNIKINDILGSSFNPKKAKKIGTVGQDMRKWLELCRKKREEAEHIQSLNDLLESL